MRAAVLLGLPVIALLLPQTGNAQVYRYDTPPPLVTAAGSAWLAGREPVFFEGSWYFPAGADVFFDGKVMVRSGVYQGVPLYTDSTREPYSVVFVPLRGTVMRPYERRRAGDIAGTTGSRTPGFPVALDVPNLRSDGPSGPTSSGAITSSPTPPFEPSGVVALRAVGTSGQLATVPRNGVWIEFQGSRWFSGGAAVDYDATRFDPAGDYRGFPVYRERRAGADRIFVTTVPDGPVAPFERR